MPALDGGLAASVLDALEDAVFAVDPDQRVTLWNRRIAQRTGVETSVALGRPVFEVMPAWQPSEQAHLAGALAGHPLSSTGFPLGGPGRFEAIYTPLDAGRGGALVTVRDLSDVRTMELGSSRDLAELKRARDELDHRVRERTAELEAFSYSVSHDLRAPLRSIDGFSLALLEDYEDRLDDTGRDYLRRVRDSAQHMGVLIDALLQLAQVGRAELHVERCDLSAMARTVLAGLARFEPTRSAQVVIQDGVSVRCDPGQLRVVLDNLLGNAWKFTSKVAHAQIEVSAVRRAGAMEVTVRDNGAGFDMANARRLFGPFQRLHRCDEFPGTGIGLATVQKIVARHGGTIWAESNPGQGARFCFTLPTGGDDGGGVDAG